MASQKLVSFDKIQPEIIPPPHAVTVSEVAPVLSLTTGSPTAKTRLCHGCVRQNRVRQIEMKERNTEVWMILIPILVKLVFLLPQKTKWAKHPLGNGAWQEE